MYITQEQLDYNGKMLLNLSLMYLTSKIKFTLIPSKVKHVLA